MDEMKKLTKEQELELLGTCLSDCSHCDQLIRQYQYLVNKTVGKVFVGKTLPFPANDVIEELANETWLNIFDKHCKKLRQYQPDKGKMLRGWISMIAMQTALMYLRQIKNQTNMVSIEEMMAKKVSDAVWSEDTEDTGQRIKSREELEIIRKCMEKYLTHQERLAFKLHFFDGLSSQEIAEMQNKKVNLIYPLISKGRKKIKECMEKADQI
jgi:RNA polymerase sigma factor (sigma-70 family)